MAASWEAAEAAAADRAWLGDGNSGTGATTTAARQSRGDSSVGKAAAAKAQMRWQSGQLRQRQRRGRDCLGDGGGGPRAMTATARRGVRKVGRKENWEREATCAGPLADSTGTCKNP